MALTASDRRDAARKLAERMFVQAGATATFNLDELDAAISATDDWIELNAAAWNVTLPLPFRSNATVAQKALLFCYCALKRAGVI